MLFTGGTFFAPRKQIASSLPLHKRVFRDLGRCTVGGIPHGMAGVLRIVGLTTCVRSFPPRTGGVCLTGKAVCVSNAFVPRGPSVMQVHLPIGCGPSTPRTSA